MGCAFKLGAKGPLPAAAGQWTPIGNFRDTPLPVPLICWAAGGAAP